MKFELFIWIDCAPEDAFAFLRDKHTYPRQPDSPILRQIGPGLCAAVRAPLRPIRSSMVRPYL